MRWFERLFRRQHPYDELAEELREHIEEKTEQLMRLENLPRDEARQVALRAFGNVALLETRSREVWQWSMLESVLADLRLTLRRLRKAPGFAATVLLTLAIGIGANTAVFSVINSVLLKPLPYPDSDRLVALWLDAPGAGGLANFSSGLQLSPSMPARSHLPWRSRSCPGSCSVPFQCGNTTVLAAPRSWVVPPGARPV
jgi:hypothetical protein